MPQCLTKVYDDNVVIVLRESWSNIISHPWLSISSMNGVNVSDQILVITTQNIHILCVCVCVCACVWCVCVRVLCVRVRACVTTRDCPGTYIDSHKIT